MPNKIKCSPSRKASYQAYRTENRQMKNKERKLLKHLLKHPDDKQSQERCPVESYLSAADKMKKQKGKENGNKKLYR
jgi:hypothetical protein